PHSYSCADHLPPRSPLFPYTTLFRSGWSHGRVIGKPADAADARRILRLLAGTQHELWTGVCLWRRPGDWQLAWQEVSSVAMKARSEEHTSELQSLAYLVCRLLLEKKK